MKFPLHRTGTLAPTKEDITPDNMRRLGWPRLQKPSISTHSREPLATESREDTQDYEERATVKTIPKLFEATKSSTLSRTLRNHCAGLNHNPSFMALHPIAY